MNGQKQIEIRQALQPLIDITKQPSDAQIKIYLNRLERYQVYDVKVAVECLVEEWDKGMFPPLAVILKHVNPSGNSVGITRKEYPDFHNQAVQVIRSPFGQMALREGWGNDLYVAVLRSGKTDWQQDDAMKFRTSRQNAVEAAMECDKARHLMPIEERQAKGIALDAVVAQTCWKLWEAMQLRERQLCDRYAA